MTGNLISAVNRLKYKNYKIGHTTTVLFKKKKKNYCKSTNYNENLMLTNLTIKKTTKKTLNKNNLY